jgi:hypothetical protein
LLDEEEPIEQDVKDIKISSSTNIISDEIHSIVGEHNDPHFIEHMTTIVDVSDADNVCFNIIIINKVFL